MSVRYEEGIHGALITDQELGLSKKGNSMGVLTIQILSKVVETQDPGTGEPVRVFEKVELSEKRKVYLALTENSVEWTADRLTKLGFRGQPSQLKDRESPGTKLVGTEALFVMKLDGSDGTYESWDVLLESSGPKAAQPTSDVQDLALDATFGGVFRESQARAVTEAPKEQVKQITAASADVPF